MVFQLRVLLAVLVGKMIAWLARFLKKGRGSSLPGMVALKICPGLLSHFVRQVRRGVVMVTGTNGKTTTNNMLARMVEEASFRTVVNAEGANLVTGIATAFIRASTWWGRLSCHYALLEVDEATFPRIIRQVKPDVVVVTNFFRDQLDRYGELDKTIAFIRDALVSLPGVQLVLNADDPLVAQLAAATGHKATFYGLSRHAKVSTTSAAAREGRFCPFCGQALEYDYYHYSQLGSYSCPSCGFSRPRAQVEGEDVFTSARRTRCRLNYPGGTRELDLCQPGLYNLYNALAAFAAGLFLGLDPVQMVESLASYLPATGRMERFRYGKKPILLNLVKNPTGFNEGLRALFYLDLPVDLLIAINDNDADGRDISWLWDVDFEMLEESHHHLNLIFCTGQRGEEMAVRLKYAGVPVDKIRVISKMEEAVRSVLQAGGASACLLATYTALWPVERILSRHAQRERASENLPSLS